MNSISCFKKRLFLLFFTTLLFSPFLFANNVTPTLEKIVRSDGDIHVVIFCKEPYSVGGNRYNLNIGNQAFVRSFHTYQDNINVLTFILSEEEFSSLQENEQISLTYGRKATASQGWDLGTLDKNLSAN